MFSYGIFVEISLDFLEQFNLLAVFIESDDIWIESAEEILKDQEWVSVEGIALNLTFSICSNQKHTS